MGKQRLMQNNTHLAKSLSLIENQVQAEGAETVSCPFHFPGWLRSLVEEMEIQRGPFPFPQ